MQVIKMKTCLRFSLDLIGRKTHLFVGFGEEVEYSGFILMY